MAKIYFDKVTNDGVQVVQVGKSQMWYWCAWSKLGYQGTINCEHPIFCNADSLRKGSYVVLEMSYMFGCIQKRLHVVASFSSLRRAVEAVGDYKDFNYKHEYTHWKTDYKLMYEYEVWHIVDDAELWESWEEKAYKSALKGYMSFEVGKAQAVELFGPCADIDFANQYRSKAGLPRVDTFLCRVCVAPDGTCYDFAFLGWYSNLDSVLVAMDVETKWESRFGRRCHFELFNVVDEVQAKLDGGHYVKLELDTLAVCHNADIPF